MGPLGQIGALIVTSLGGLYLLAILLRFLLQIARADFYNPITQSIVKITNTPVRLLRRVVPGWKGIDFTTLLLALFVHGIFITLLFIFNGQGIPPIEIVVTWSAFGTLSYILNIYKFALLISIISSFIAPYNAHPILTLVRQLTEPLMAPFRRLIPAMGGLDISPLFVFLSIYSMQIVINAIIYMEPALVLGY